MDKWTWKSKVKWPGLALREAHLQLHNPEPQHIWLHVQKREALAGLDGRSL